MSERGCGSRVQGGLYLTVPLSKDGKPIEFFLVDPAIPWTGGTLRAPQMFRLPDDEVKHVIMGVGETYYPFVCDFIEETRVMGISKRVPLSIDLADLIPGESRLLLTHPNSIPEFPYIIHAYGQQILKGSEKNPGCPKEKAEAHLCLGDTYPLSADPVFSSDKHEVEVVPLESIRKVKTPSTSYKVFMEEIEVSPPLTYQAGIFLKFPYFQFQFVSKSGNVPRKVAEKFETSSFDLDVVSE